MSIRVGPAAQIAFLGTGLMGAPMARRLLRSGYRVTAWNRTRAKAEALASDGAVVADTPSQAVADADVVLSILENNAVVEDVLFAQHTAQAVRSRTLFIDLSSIAPDYARAHAAKLDALGCSHLDAPVSGGPNGAEEGSLAIMVGGGAEDFERAKPILAAMGHPTLVGACGAGQFAKLASQMIASTALAAVAEALLLARAAGIDPLRIRAALAGGFADSRVLQIHGKRMVDRDFVPGGHVHTFLKDLTAARAVSLSHRLDLPVTSLTYALFENLASRAATCDIAAMALEIEARNIPHRIGESRDKLPESNREEGEQEDALSTRQSGEML